GFRAERQSKLSTSGAEDTAAIFWFGVQHQPLVQVVHENTGLRGTSGVGQGGHGKTLSLKSKRPISEAESIVAAIKSAAPVAEHVITVEKSLAAAMGSSLLDAAAAKVVKAANRRVCLTRFKSRCGSSFCDSHRYPERTTIATTISRKLGRIQLLKQIRSSRIKWNYGFSVVTYLVLLLNRFYSFSYKLF
ncbi:unnamed protein product, partial [Linum tenue]